MILRESAPGSRGKPPTAISLINWRMIHSWTLAASALPLLLLPNCLAQSNLDYIITTIAGSGPSNVPNGGYGGDGGPATSALLNSPASVALDRLSNLYFCDFSARVRRVDARTGIVTTVAGTGTRGYSGDGGPAINAQLGGPGDITVDAAGNIYIGDGSNHRVRRVSVDTGIITTVAGNGSMNTGIYRTIAGRTLVENSGDGGPAINTGIGIPGGLAVDVRGDLYFTNIGDRVRKVAAGTGIITTVAGAGGSYHSGDGGPAVLAQLDQPAKVAIDIEGNIYIAARGEHRIRKVNVATGIITTVAGASFGVESGPPFVIFVYQGGFSGDGGKAGNLYIADVFNYRIRRVDARTGIITTIAGTGVIGFSGDGGPASRAQMTTPSSLAVDVFGRIFFADQANHRIRVLIPAAPASLR
jgi:sugar lactone lactonase YvrE